MQVTRALVQTRKNKNRDPRRKRGVDGPWHKPWDVALSVCSGEHFPGRDSEAFSSSNSECLGSLGPEVEERK